MRADGYHLIDAEMVTLDLADTLTFSEGDGLEVDGAGPDVPPDDDNLVRRALRAVGRTAHVGSTSASRPAPAWAAGRPTPPRCCAGPASTT